ncbi:MAG: peptide-methionine (S)-S-oxide reductase MsrA [Chloroflexi bacterium]|nr:peptide-methionine (S)-S-oxide reductase MsrA [Chloroflexota bacterium]
MTQQADGTAGTHAHEVATFAGGCFWCVEAVFEQVRGVSRIVSGYTGGHISNPTYEQVCGGMTGHAEAVQVTFDPAAVSFPDLLRIFFSTHDPTTRNRQGPDEGPQYRSAVYYSSPDQQRDVEAVMAELTTAELWPRPFVTEVVPLGTFFVAETYHQQYFRNNQSAPYCQFIIAPKVAKFRGHFLDKLKA